MRESTTATTPDEIRVCEGKTQKLRQRLERWQAMFWNRTSLEPRILILGAGYAGLTCALGLKKPRAHVTLINRNDYHYLTTLLHEPAVGRRDFHEVTVDLPQLLEGSPIQFLRREVLGIDLEGQTVTVSQQGQEETLAYDFLVIALGSQPEFYDVPGLAEHALTLSNWSEARRVHLRVEEALINYKDHPEEPWRAHIVIGGAGLTGVELAGEMADWCHRAAREYGIPDGVLRITLLDGGPSVLASCKECQDRIIPLTTQLLERKGIRIVTGAHVKAIEDHCLLLGDDRTLEAGLILWTGGVRGHRLIEGSGLAVNRQKRALVNEYLQAQGHPEVFVVGDSAAATMANGVVLPPTAQLAIQQGPMVARNFCKLLSCQPLTSCEPQRLGIFISVGEKDALGVVQNRYHFSGWAARTIKNAIGYRYLISLGGWKLLWSKWRGVE
ncbi:MAG TPA: NAD(P)/FAD-dependent oxidoreductase [Candidatus Bipolaricaulota bacterium]